MRKQIPGLGQPLVRRATRDQVTEVDEVPDSYYQMRNPTSTRRYIDIHGREVIRQGNKQYVIHTQPPPLRRRAEKSEHEEVYPKRKLHPLLWPGLAMLIMFFGWISLSALGSWWQTTQDDWHFGRPRTYQIDAVVGHSDSASNPSHFIAINLNRHIEVIEIPGGDASHAQIYIGPTLLGDKQDLTPVTLSFSDVNGDGKPDMIMHILDQTIIFLNDGKKFTSPKPE